MKRNPAEDSPGPLPKELQEQASQIYDKHPKTYIAIVCYTRVDDKTGDWCVGGNFDDPKDLAAYLRDAAKHFLEQVGRNN